MCGVAQVYSSVAVDTTVAVLTLLAGVAALRNIDGICRTDL